MSITDKVQKDMTAAMKAKDKERAQALRLILSQLQLAQKESSGNFGEQEEIKVLASEKKRRQQAAEAFREGGREDRAEGEENEARLIDEYLPQAMSEEELAAIVEEAVSSTGAVSMKEMGKVMSQVMAKTAGRADGKVVSEMVKKKLEG